MGAKETGGQLSLWDCGFSLNAIFDPFFWQQKGPKWRGSRIISLISKIGIQNPPKTSCQRSNPTKLIPRAPPEKKKKKQFQTPFWGSKILRKGSLLVLEGIYLYWLVVWLGTFFIFPYIGNNHPDWLIFFRGVETTNQLYIYASQGKPHRRPLPPPWQACPWRDHHWDL